jgi:photosystem II stability/assembly factor-like uncharacterized protein
MKSIVFVLIGLISCQLAFAQFLPEFNEQSNEKPNYYLYKEAFEKWSENNNLNATKGWKWYQRIIENEQAYINPDGTYLPASNYLDVWNQIQSMKINKKDEIQNQSGWIPVGPDTRGKAFDTVSAHGIGRINTVAFHPENKDILWIGTPNGGIWKTENQGQSWFPVSDFLPSIRITDIEVDPNNPDVLYMSTGDADAINWYYNATAMGVFKSTDGGLNWQPTGLSYTSSTFNRSYIRKIIVHNENSNNLLAAGTYGIWTSSDAGVTWEKIMDSLMVVDMKQDPSNPDILYGATQWFSNSYSRAGIIKSTDFGKNWKILDSQIPPVLIVSRVAVAVSPADPNYIYAIAVNRANSGLFAFFKSTDAGESWSSPFNYEQGFNLLGWYDGDDSDMEGQGYYDLTLICDKSDKNKVIAGGVNLWGTTDGGDNWEIATLWIDVFDETIHADQHFSDYNPVDDYYYFCNDGGIFRTKEVKLGQKKWITDWVDRQKENVKPGYPGFNIGTKWEDLTEGLAITEFYRLGICRELDGYYAGGSQDNSAFYYDGNQWINYVTNYDGMEAMIHHTEPYIFYGASQFGRLCKTTNGGITQDCSLTDTILNLEGRGSWITPLLMDPVNPDIIYAGFKNVWKSTNGGDNWKKIFNSEDYSSPLFNINYLAISRTNPNLIAMAKPNNNYWKDTVAHGLWLSKDAGESWFKPLGLPLDSILVNAIDITGGENEKIYVAFTQNSYKQLKVFMSEDFGESWINISKDLPNVTINTIVHQDDSEKNNVYIGTNNGVLYTSDELDSWVPFIENLPNTIVRDIEIHYPTQKINAATYGRGIWQADLIDTKISVDDKTLHDNDIIIAPNPNNGSFSFNFSGDNIRKNIKIEIVDIFGKVLFNNEIINNSMLNNEISVDFPTGQYYLKVSVGNIMKVKKFLIIR